MVLVLKYVTLLIDDVLVAVSGEENSGLKATSRREHENIVENYKEVIKEQVRMAFTVFAFISFLK